MKKVIGNLERAQKTVTQIIPNLKNFIHGSLLLNLVIVLLKQMLRGNLRLQVKSYYIEVPISTIFI